MLGFISMPGGWEWLIMGSCFLIPAILVVVAIVFVVVKHSQKPPTVTCGKCGQPNPTTSRFCSQCAQSLQNKAE